MAVSGVNHCVCGGGGGGGWEVVTYTLLSHEPTNRALESGRTAKDERG